MQVLAKVPSLSAAGWVSDLRQGVDILMGHLFVSDFSHSTTAPGSITSFAALVQKYNHDQSAMEQQSQVAIQEYLRKYIPDCDVEVEAIANPENPVDNGEYILKITISAYRNGERLNLAEQLDISGSKFKRITEMNNG